jgi:hypothetical protein
MWELGSFLFASPNGRAEQEPTLDAETTPSTPAAGSRNIIYKSLFSQNKVVLPPLNVKLYLKKRWKGITTISNASATNS